MMLENTMDLLLAASIIMLSMTALIISSVFRSILLFMGLGLLTAICWARLDAWDIAIAEVIIGSGISGILLIMSYFKLTQKR